METLKRIRVLVEGRVQGVYYRASTQQQAVSLGVTGWVRNLADGSVEFEAQGSNQQLLHLLDWAKQGPSNAQVTSVTESVIPLVNDEQQFNIHY